MRFERNIFKRNLFKWLLVLLAVVTLAACGGKDKEQPGKESSTSGQANAAVRTTADGKKEAAQPEAKAGKTDGAPATEKRSTLPNVEVTRITPRNFQVEQTYIGHLLPIQRIELRSEVEGVVEKTLIEEGDTVTRGQPMFHVGTSSFRIRRNLASSNRKLALSNFTRDKKLREKNLIAEAQLDVSRNQLESATYTMELAELEYQKSIITAPIAGTIKTRAIDVGEFARKAELLAEILDTSQLKVLINVPEKEVNRIRVKLPVGVTLDALPDKSFPGSVSQVGLEADQKNRSFPVEVVIKNPDQALRAGMLARVGLQVGDYQKQVLIPRFAVLEREKSRVVFVLKDGLVQERKVTVGLGQGGDVQVLEGLAFDEMLVTKGQQKLSGGERVNVVAQFDQSKPVENAR